MARSVPMDEHMAEAHVRGPLARLQRAAHVERLTQLLPLLVAVAWLPLLLLAVVEQLVTRRSEPLLRDASIHVRLLVALPLLAAGERLLERSGAVTLKQLVDEEYVPPSCLPRLRRITARVARWDASALVASLIALIALAAGLATLTGLLAPTGTFPAVGAVPYGAPRMWYGLVSLPLFHFFLWRSLFHWLSWVRVLAALSRMPLRLLPAHADRTGGIGFLKLPTVGYAALVLLAASSVLAGGWAMRLARDGLRLEDMTPLLIAFVLVGLGIALAPLLLFVPQLVRARLEGKRQYGALMSAYVRRFQTQWIGRAARPELLGTPDIQSLADLGNTYRENVERLRVVPFAMKDWVVLLAAALLPIVPLVFLKLPAAEAIAKLARLALGSLPR